MHGLTMLTMGMLLTIVLALGPSALAEGGLRIGVSVPSERAVAALDGRMLLMLSTDASDEPRFQIGDSATTQQIFGVDVDGLEPGVDAMFDASVLGYPLASMKDVPPGDYWVQALLHRYETFHRSDGHTVKLPMDRGEGQHWNRAPGNLYSTPRKIRIDPAQDELIRLSLDSEIPPIEPPQDSKYIKHYQVKSVDIRRRGRKGNLSRDVAIFLSRELSGHSGQDLGREFGKISGAAICVRCKHIVETLAANRKLKREIREIKAGILNI